jgi:hypothetical protein
MTTFFSFNGRIGKKTMDRFEAISIAQRESAKANGERRYAVPWPDGHWTVETRKPSLAAGCILAVEGKLEHA